MGGAVLFQCVLGPANVAMNVPFTSVAVALIPLEYIISKSHSYSNKETFHLPEV